MPECETTFLWMSRSGIGEGRIDAESRATASVLSLAVSTYLARLGQTGPNTLTLLSVPEAHAFLGPDLDGFKGPISTLSATRGQRGQTALVTVQSSRTSVSCPRRFHRHCPAAALCPTHDIPYGVGAGNGALPLAPQTLGDSQLYSRPP
jgi:hypothetical protein